MQEYGKKIKEIRKERGLTLMEFSEQTGLSVGFLSKIERGLNSPSFPNLQKICYALGVSSAIFDQTDPLPDGLQKPCVRKEDRSLIYAYGSGEKMEHLLSTAQNLSISMMTLSGKKKTRTSACHSQNEFGVILRGEMQITMNGEAHRLGPEDGILVPAGTEHITERLGKEECVSVWVKFD